MKLITQERWGPVTTYSYSTLTASGEPHRRTWTIKARWDLRDGKVRGDTMFQNQWLSGALTQLHRLEWQCLGKGTGTDSKPHFELYCPDHLVQSVLRTASRYGIPLEDGRCD
jgi:hypothetical protein